MAKADLSAERLRELLHYDPETGNFTWRLSSSRRVRIGSIAGSQDAGGYCIVGIDGKRYYAHRLAWLYTNGTWPENEIDHINGERFDNKICNLRDVSRWTNSQNQKNAHSNNKSSGLLGVSFHKKAGKWVASIHLNGRLRNLGSFPTAELAQLAYLAEKRLLHAGCTI